MEDVLSLYEQAPDPDYPLVCFDETSKQLTKETRASIPVKSGKANRYDYEYERNGVRNIFMFFAPHQNFRHAQVTERRTKVDWARCMKKLVNELFPKAKKRFGLLRIISILIIPQLFTRLLSPPKRAASLIKSNFTLPVGSIWLR